MGPYRTKLILMMAFRSDKTKCHIFREFLIEFSTQFMDRG